MNPVQGLRGALRGIGLARLTAPVERLAVVARDTLAQALPADPWLLAHRGAYRGQRCFVLGNGPSLNRTDLGRLEGETTFGVNGIFLAEGFRPTFYVATSATYWRQHVEEIRRVDCERRFLPSDTRTLASQVPTSWLRHRRPRYYGLLGDLRPIPAAFSRRPDRLVFGGGTVLYVCLQLALHLGFETAILLGVDHDYGAGKGRNTDKRAGSYLENTGNLHFSDSYHTAPVRFHLDLEAIERAFELARQAFAADGRQILNASPGSKLETLPLVDYDSLF